MKKYFFLLLFAVPISSPAQIIDTIFYDNVWKISYAENAAFFRIAEVDTLAKKFTGEVSDYFATGELFMTGNYNNDGKKDGEFRWHYGNGKLFMNGFFSNDSLVGVWKMYFNDGNVRQRLEFNDMEFIIWDLVDEQGKEVIKNGTGLLQSIELGLNPTVLIIKGEVREGRRQGKWIIQTQTGWGVREVKEEYKDGLFYVGRQGSAGSEEKYFQSKLNADLYCPPNLKAMETFEVERMYAGRYRPASMFESFSEVEQQPDYPGGMGAFYLMISRNLHYPALARRIGLEGKVFVKFVVQEDGSVTEVEAIRGIGGGCDEEAVRVVKLSEKWIPGAQAGKAVKVRMIVPITFRRD